MRDSRAAATIGQGTVLSTPMGMATVAASVAKGAAVSPVLVLDGGSRRPASPARPLTAAESEQLRSLMRGVVTDGSARFLADVPGGPVSAKTGTAEYGTDEPPHTHAWMIGTQGDLAVAVFVADGPGGASTAGPVLEDREEVARRDLDAGLVAQRGFDRLQRLAIAQRCGR